MRQAALLGRDVTFLALLDVMPWLERGELVRVVPGWHVHAGEVSIYYPTRNLLPAKTACSSTTWTKPSGTIACVTGSRPAWHRSRAAR